MEKKESLYVIEKTVRKKNQSDFLRDSEEDEIEVEK